MKDKMEKQPETMAAGETRPPKTYGYARVSTREQNEDRQLDEFEREKIPHENIFVDHKSGSDFDRPAYIEMLSKLRKGDKLVVTSLDRLGRDYLETVAQWRMLSVEKGVSVKVLDSAIFDKHPGETLLHCLIRELVLNLMAFIAQNERDNIKARQTQGIAAAQKRGVKFGRPRSVKPAKFDEIVGRVRRGELSKKAGAGLLGMPASTFRSMLER